MPSLRCLTGQDLQRSPPRYCSRLAGDRAQGAFIEDISGIQEGYTTDGNVITASVSAGKIPALFEAFLNSMREDESLFMFIEAPCNEEDERKYNNIKPGDPTVIKEYHRDVYYLDSYNREDMMSLLKSGAGDVLINDGLVCSGFGSLDTHVEIGKYRYITFTGYSLDQDISCISKVFDMAGIPSVPQLVTGWNVITRETPGRSNHYKYNVKDIYALPEDLKQLGIHKVETLAEWSGEVVWKERE